CPFHLSLMHRERSGLLFLFFYPFMCVLIFFSLYPSAFLIKRGAYSLINPTFLHSEEDAKLLFEVLLAGMQIQGEERPLLIPDEELASLRSVKTLEVICEDVLPKKLSDIRRLMAKLAQRRRPLGWQDFERTVLTLVYSSQILGQISNQHQKELWMETLVQLVRAVQRDLTPS
uniref:Family with sequence similarity 180 member A n=1 Tax=Poecilia latipinna TaxID=48699 RepID=A0A3B3VKD5_9TELE